MEAKFEGQCLRLYYVCYQLIKLNDVQFHVQILKSLSHQLQLTKARDNRYPTHCTHGKAL